MAKLTMLLFVVPKERKEYLSRGEFDWRCPVIHRHPRKDKRSLVLDVLRRRLARNRDAPDCHWPMQ
jgi:hypothetical protein